MVWPLIVGAAISAAAAAKASSDARRARLGAQSAQDAQVVDDYARQKEFAQNAIQWRVADAKAAGLHPLFALQGGGASYSPAARQVFSYDAAPTLALGSSLGQMGGAIAKYYETDAKELYGPPYSGEEPVATSWSIPNYSVGDAPSSLAAIEYPKTDYGMVSNVEKPSMAYWQVPGLGRVIAPEATNFSEALEGVESPIGQGLILYLNRDLGDQALGWLANKMGLNAPSGSSALQRLARHPAWSDPVGTGLSAVKAWLDGYRR